jgi:hypothetical protein
MPDVFISYSHNDANTAQAIRHKLEARRIRCWMDTGSLQHGDDWKLQIVDALSSSSVVVLVLSSHSNASKDVKAEIDVAYRHEIPILPFCIEKVQMRKEFEYIIGGRHWLDALTPPMEDHIARLCNSVEALLEAQRANGAEADAAQTAAPAASAAKVPLATTTRKPISRVAMALAAVAIVVVIGGIAFRSQLAGLVSGASTAPDEKAVIKLQGEATRGDPAAQEKLGEAYERGTGTDTSYDSALRWYEDAAGQGNATAAAAIRRLSNGWTIPPLLPGNWQDVTGKARRDELTQIESSEFFGALHSSDVRRMRRLALSFSPGATLYELEVVLNHSQLGLLTYVHLGDRLVVIDGTPRGVADIMSPQHAQIRSATDAESFVRFLTAGLQSPVTNDALPGVYRFVDDASEIQFAPSATQEQRALVAHSIQPISTEQIGKTWRVTGATTVGHSLAKIEVTIDESGVPHLRLVKIIVEALPIPLDVYDSLGVRMRRVTP